MRLFVGLALDAPAKAALAKVADALMPVMPARFVPPTLYHVTLAYFGERAETALPAIAALIEYCAHTCTMFALGTESIGYFGKPESAILYASLAPSVPLETLGATLRVQLRQAGEPFDGSPLVPHITLARKAALAVAIPALPDGLPPCKVPFMANALTLFHSTRVDGTLVYLPLHIAPFQTTPGGQP